MTKGLPKIVLMLCFVIFPTGLATSRETATGGATTHATAANAGEEGRTRRRTRNSGSSRRRHVRRAGKRRLPMTRPTQTTENTQPRDAGQREDPAGQKKVEEIDKAGKTQPPAPRQPRRRYDPVLQPPEKTRVP